MGTALGHADTPSYARAVLLDQSLRATFRNFSTLFLMAAIITIPLHVGHSFVYRGVIAVQDLHSDIETFPAGRQVHSVGREQLDDARIAFWAITALEVLLLPLVAGAAGRVLEVDARGGLPTVVDAWAHPRLRAPERPGPPVLWPVPVAAALALGVWLLVERIGMVVVEPLPDVVSFAGTGLVLGISRAASVPFVVVTALITLRAKKATGSSLSKGG